MNGILVISEVRQGQVRDITRELVGAADALRRAAGQPLPISLAVLAHDPGALRGELQASGADELLLVPMPAEHFEASLAADAVTRLIDELGPVAVLIGHTVDGMGFAPAVAACGGHGFASDVIGVGWDDGVVATRGVYGNKLEDVREFPGRATTVLMVRPGVFAAPEPTGEVEVRELSVELPSPTIEHLGFQEAPAGDVDITKAPFLLSVGRGIGDQENLERFARLADQIGATLSVSRPLVDAGWISSARQVGQSGRTVSSKVYVALGISGSVQHLAGIKSVETVIAVNSDPEAPIFAVADYGAVADLFEVVDRLGEALAV